MGWLRLRDDDGLPMASAYQRQGTCCAGKGLPALLRSRARGPCSGTAPRPVGTSRAGRAPWRTPACWPWASRRSASRAHGGDQPRGLQSGAGLPGGAGISGAAHQRVLVLLTADINDQCACAGAVLADAGVPWERDGGTRGGVHGYARTARASAAAGTAIRCVAISRCTTVHVVPVSLSWPDQLPEPLWICYKRHQAIDCRSADIVKG